MDALLLLSPQDRELIEGLKMELAKSAKSIPNVLLSNNEVARLLGMNPSYVSVLIKRKKLTKRTIGKSCGILLKDVLAYKTRREGEGAANV